MVIATRNRTCAVCWEKLAPEAGIDFQIRINEWTGSLETVAVHPHSSCQPPEK